MPNGPYERPPAKDWFQHTDLKTHTIRVHHAHAESWADGTWCVGSLRTALGALDWEGPNQKIRIMKGHVEPAPTIGFFASIWRWVTSGFRFTPPADWADLDRRLRHAVKAGTVIDERYPGSAKKQSEWLPQG